MVYQDIPRIYTALAEWCACMVYCFILKRRWNARRFAIVSAAALAGFCIFLSYTGIGTLPLAFWLPCMMLAAFGMFAFLAASCDISKLAAGYCAARGFLLSEFAASLEWQLDCYLRSVWEVGPAVRLLLLAVVYGGVFFGGWFLEKESLKGDFQMDINVRELYPVLLIVIAVFAFSNLSFVYAGTPFSSRIAADIFNIRTLVDFGGLAVLHAFQSRIYELKAAQEFAAMNTMLKRQYEHYRHYQESIDIINMKYHDLKHQIAGLRAEISPEKRGQWLDAMEQEVNLSKTGEETGNPVLDTVLTGKQMFCQTKNIELTCVADGRILEFMHVTDLCTIFGNALDNAIESVIQIEDPEKRLIHLSVSEKKKYVFILVENYCENSLTMKEQYPVTTKSDRQNHGFGLKSICYSAEKYQGTVTFSVENHWFRLKILIPIPDQSSGIVL